MELVRLDVAIAQRDGVAGVAREHTILFRCADADTVMVAASLGDALTTPFGVWLDVSSGYPAQLAARDVATLAALAPLRHVAVAAASVTARHAEVLRALLTNDEVNFTNEVAILRHAFNRPAPRSPITVWSFEAGRLVSGAVDLGEVRVECRAVGELTYFA